MNWRDASENDKGVAVEGNKCNSSHRIITVHGEGERRRGGMGDLQLKMKSWCDKE